MSKDLKFINRILLKYIAIVAMTMDHVAGAMLVEGSAIWLVFRIIGRLTAPIMIFQLSDGFLYTHDLKKYIQRMFVFSIISIFTFSFLETGSFLPIRLLDGRVTDYQYNYIYLPGSGKTLCICNLNVIFTFFLGLLSLTVWEKTSFKTIWKVLLTVLFVAISMICDWKFIPIFMALGFYFFRNDKCKKWTVYSILSLIYIFNIFFPDNALNFSEWVQFGFKPYRIGMVLAPVIIELFYNGKPGKKSAFNKWFFYIYYPLHQIILGLFAIS